MLNDNEFNFRASGTSMISLRLAGYREHDGNPLSVPI